MTIKLVKNGDSDHVILGWWTKLLGVVMAGLVTAAGVNAAVQLAAIPVMQTRLDHHDEEFQLMQQQINDSIKRMESAIEGANVARAAVAADVRALSEALNALRVELAEQRGVSGDRL